MLAPLVGAALLPPGAVFNVTSGTGCRTVNAGECIEGSGATGDGVCTVRVEAGGSSTSYLEPVKYSLEDNEWLWISSGGSQTGFGGPYKRKDVNRRAVAVGDRLEFSRTASGYAGVYNNPGFSICLRETPPAALSGTVVVAAGDCAVSGAGDSCVSSPAYPGNYPRTDRCELEIGIASGEVTFETRNVPFGDRLDKTPATTIRTGSTVSAGQRVEFTSNGDTNTGSWKFCVSPKDGSGSSGIGSGLAVGIGFAALFVVAVVGGGVWWAKTHPGGGGGSPPPAGYDEREERRRRELDRQIEADDRAFHIREDNERRRYEAEMARFEPNPY